MPKRGTDYRKTLLESLTDPTEAALYLEASLEDSPKMFLVALRDVVESRRMAKVAEHAGVARETLYRTLSEKGNPSLSSLSAILEAVGCRISIVPLESQKAAELPDSKRYTTAYAAAARQEMQINVIGVAAQQGGEVISGGSLRERKLPKNEAASALIGPPLYGGTTRQDLYV